MVESFSSHQSMNEVRKRMVERIFAGDGIKTIAFAFGVNPVTVDRAKKRRDETGKHVDRSRSRRPRPARAKATITAVKGKGAIPSAPSGRWPRSTMCQRTP